MKNIPQEVSTISVDPGTQITMEVMTWNIRRLIPDPVARGQDRWETRAPRIRSALSGIQPTVLGIQEALPEQTDFLHQVLGPTYRSVGQGRGRNNTGEATPIFFDTDQLKLISWEQQALSNKPATPGSVSWGNIFPRAFVAATFLHLQTTTRFMVINTHLDHLSQRSRLRSADTIRRFIQPTALPAVVTGDFNADQNSRTHGAFTHDGLLVDTWSTAAAHLTREWGTFPNYRDPKPGGKRIDWILSTPDWQVHRTGINADQYAGGWASDHLFVHSLMTPPGNTGNDATNDRQFHPPAQGFQ